MRITTWQLRSSAKTWPFHAARSAKSFCRPGGGVQIESGIAQAWTTGVVVLVAQTAGGQLDQAAQVALRGEQDAAVRQPRDSFQAGVVDAQHAERAADLVERGGDPRRRAVGLDAQDAGAAFAGQQQRAAWRCGCRTAASSAMPSRSVGRGPFAGGRRCRNGRSVATSVAGAGAGVPDDLVDRVVVAIGDGEHVAVVEHEA